MISLNSIIKILKDNKGITTLEVLILTSLMCALAVFVTGRIAPQVKAVHNNTVDNMSDIMQSGF